MSQLKITHKNGNVFYASDLVPEKKFLLPWILYMNSHEREHYGVCSGIFIDDIIKIEAIDDSEKQVNNHGNN